MRRPITFLAAAICASALVVEPKAADGPYTFIKDVEIGGEGVVGIAIKHRLEQRPGFCIPAQAKVCLGLKKESGRFLPELKVVIEKEHSWERGSKVINFCRLCPEFTRIGEQVAEELFGLCPLTKPFARHGRVVRHLAESSHTHVLKIAFEVCGGGPVTARGFHVASGGAGTAEPVMDVALVGEQVFGFA